MFYISHLIVRRSNKLVFFLLKDAAIEGLELGNLRVPKLEVTWKEGVQGNKLVKFQCSTCN